MKNKGFEIVKNAKEKTADIWLYQDIGEGWFGGLSAKDFADEVKKIGMVDVINVFINSPGGDVFDGVAMFNILKRNKAKIVVEIDGLAASIASVIAMAGNEIRMAENAMMMIHNPWGMVVGDATDMRKAADEMDKVRDSAIITAYVNQSGMDEKDIIELMDAETWMSAEEAQEYGLIDEITAEKKMAAHFDMTKYKFKNMPDMKTDKDDDKHKKVITPSIDKWSKKIAAR